MIISCKHKGVKDIFNGDNTKYARKTCPQNLWKAARRKLDQLDFAASLNDLRSPPKNRLEALKGDYPSGTLRDREGQHSIRINDQYRICFIWSNDGVKDVEIVDYH
jgi:proteic killer suppression protein